MEIVTEIYVWRNVFVGLTAIIFLVALLIFTLVLERKSGATAQSFFDQFRGVGAIFADHLCWAIMPLLAPTAGSHVAFQTL